MPVSSRCTYMCQGVMAFTHVSTEKVIEECLGMWHVDTVVYTCVHGWIWYVCLIEQHRKVYVNL